LPLSDQVWYSPLREIACELNRRNVAYHVVGGAALALHGARIETEDVDIETDRDGAYLFQELFTERATLPVAWRQSNSYRSHFGRFDFDGVSVEVMGQIERRNGSVWVCTMVSTTDIVDLDGVAVRVPWLEEEVLANIRRGRMDRAGDCLKLCDSERMLKLIRGAVRTHVV